MKTKPSKNEDEAANSANQNTITDSFVGILSIFATLADWKKRRSPVAESKSYSHSDYRERKNDRRSGVAEIAEFRTVADENLVYYVI